MIVKNGLTIVEGIIHIYFIQSIQQTLYIYTNQTSVLITSLKIRLNFLLECFGVTRFIEQICKINS